MKTIKKFQLLFLLLVLIFAIVPSSTIEASAVPVEHVSQRLKRSKELKKQKRQYKKDQKRIKKQASEKGQKKTDFFGAGFWFWTFFIIFILIVCVVLLIVGLVLNIYGMWIPALAILLIPIIWGIVATIKSAVYKAKEKKEEKEKAEKKS